jgi:hypothetical protein
MYLNISRISESLTAIIEIANKRFISGMFTDVSNHISANVRLIAAVGPLADIDTKAVLLPNHFAVLISVLNTKFSVIGIAFPALNDIEFVLVIKRSGVIFIVDLCFERV